MKQFLFAIPLLLLWSCNNDPLKPEVEHYSTLDLVQEMNTNDIGNPPQDAQRYGDTLYVLTRDSLNITTLELFNYKTLEHLESFKTWSDSSGKIDSLYEGMTLTITDSLICVGSEKSRVDIFERSSLNYISTVGNGNWWGNEETLIVHSFALSLTDEFIFIRDKRSIRVYSLDDLTYENRKSVPIAARSIELGVNSSKVQFGMINNGAQLFVTDAPNKSIEIFNLADFTVGTMDITPVDTLHLNSAPYDIALYNDMLYIVTKDARIEVYESTTREFIRQYNAIRGHDFDSPRTIQFSEDDFFIIETASQTLVTGNVNYHKISIYE